jgi:hypothetical protein
MEPEEVKTVSKNRVSEEKRTTASLPVMKESFRQESTKRAVNDSMSSNNLFIASKVSLSLQVNSSGSKVIFNAKCASLMH